MTKYDTESALRVLVDTEGELLPELHAPVLDAAELLDAFASLQRDRGARVRRIGQLKIAVSIGEEVATIEYANAEWKGSNGPFQLHADVRYDQTRNMFIGQNADGLLAVVSMACDLLKARRAQPRAPVGAAAATR